MDDLIRFRAQIDAFMQQHPQSPLEAAQQQAFSGLAYFEPNPDLVLEGSLARFPTAEPPIEMETSTGERQLYRRYGRFTFTVDGEEATLTIYADAHGHDFFLPFRDATSGQETYGAGRYLDNHRPGLERIGRDRFRLDFNYAYNPYCAYSADYSCPLPPQENWLKVAIRAGEKVFGK